MNDDIKLMIEAMHSIYVAEKKDRTKLMADVKVGCKRSLEMYWLMCGILDRLDLGDQRMQEVIKHCSDVDNINKWFHWAAIDSNLAKMNLKGHTREPKSGDRDGSGQATQDSSSNTDGH